MSHETDMRARKAMSFTGTCRHAARTDECPLLREQQTWRVLEDIVSKHRDRAYRAGRSTNWIKFKNPASLKRDE